MGGAGKDGRQDLSQAIVKLLRKNNSLTVFSIFPRQKLVLLVCLYNLSTRKSILLKQLIPTL